MTCWLTFDAFSCFNFDNPEQTWILESVGIPLMVCLNPYSQNSSAFFIEQAWRWWAFTFNFKCNVANGGTCGEAWNWHSRSCSGSADTIWGRRRMLWGVACRTWTFGFSVYNQLWHGPQPLSGKLNPYKAKGLNVGPMYIICISLTKSYYQTSRI